MKKVIVIGCPGSGKSVFSRTLHDITGLPLYHLDMINWHEDKTTLSREELIEKINEIGATDEWIMDGNYGGTMELRMSLCDTIVFLDFPTDVCLEGIMARRGTQRPDMPWQDSDNLEPEFIDSVKNYYSQNRPTVLERIKKFSGKKSLVFKSRQEADGFLAKLRSENVIAHYDALIDEGNDPVTDPKPLKEYMDKWDGQTFIDKMQLTPEKSVLEIGVGTGRLAVRVAPFCEEFTGIDISPKTIERAKDHLGGFVSIHLICADFSEYDFDSRFDVIYSSLTFMHFSEKQKAINKIYGLLNPGGKFVLSIDKNQDEFIDIDTRKLRIHPDKPEEIKTHLKLSGFENVEITETEFGYIFSAERK